MNYGETKNTLRATLRNKSVDIAWAAFLLLFVAGYGFLGSLSSGPARAKVAIGGTSFVADVARTAAEEEKGLSGRPAMADDAGMIFLFAKPGNYGFWMKGMEFPIDIVWISAASSSRNLPGKIWEGRIVGFAENLPVPGRQENFSQFPVYYPPRPVSGVLEINAGLAKKYGLRENDTVSISL